MTTILKADISQTLGQSLIEDIFLQRSRYYYAIGRCYPWANELVPDDVIDSEKYEKETRRDILFAKQIQGTSVSFTIPRYNYVRGVFYDKYDDIVSMSGKRFYVLNSDYNVYKCLDNNGGLVSTDEPYGTSATPIRLGDNYVWQFIYTIPPSLRAKFLTDMAMPVYNAITEKYYSRGSISAVRVNAGGAGYVESTTDIIVSGDGYLADNPQKVTEFIIEQPGAGYTTVSEVQTTDQFNNYISFATGLAVVQGQYLKVDDSAGVRFYEVITPGITSSTVPTNYYSTVSNGTATIKHVGTKPKVVATVSDDVVGTVKVLNNGFGYTFTPAVTKLGSGTGTVLQANMSGNTVQSVTVVNGGTGHTLDNVEIEAPYPSAVILPLSTAVGADAIYYYDISGLRYYYRVDAAGTTAASGPTFTTGSSSSGTAVLTVVARRAVAEAILGVVASVSAYSDISNIRVLDGGTGYVDGTTTVEFVGGSPTVPAQAVATIASGIITAITITFPGYGYQSQPTVIIDGDGEDATAIATMQLGYGYREAPSLIFSDPDDVDGSVPITYSLVEKTEAILLPVIYDGILRGVRIIDGGTGYTQATITVVGAGSGAVLVPIFASSELNTIQAQAELLATAGTVSSIVMLDVGTNISAVNLTLNGDGTGVQLSPYVLNGQLLRLDVINPGSGYTFLEVSIEVNSDATQPSARAVIAPSLGHGSNPIKELYSKAIALNATISNEDNNGFEISNAFRQISILKSPHLYNQSKLVENLTSSACLVIDTNLSGIPVAKNLLLINSSDNSVYRVVDFTNSQILLQTITNGSLNPTDVLNLNINNVTYNINVYSINLPNFDKNTGELLYIDNQLAFTPSSNQSVNITTTISLT